MGGSRMNSVSTYSIDDEDTSDFLSEDAPAAVATLEDVVDNDCCEKCSAALTNDAVQICRRCGWYASLNTFIELDQAWETAFEEPQDTEPEFKPTDLGGWLRLVPRWGWVIIGSTLMIVVESVVACLATGGSIRTTWSLAQLALGAVIAIGCHAFNFLQLAANDSDIGLLDLVLKPMRLWIQRCGNLPRGLRLVNSAACGLMMIFGAVVIIGAIPYERLWECGPKGPARHELMGAVVNRMTELTRDDGNKSLEGAVADFAGNAAADTPHHDGPRDVPKEGFKADCVILGYTLDKAGDLFDLVLGAANHGKLVFAGRVTPKISDSDAKDLVASLKSITVSKPFIPLSAGSALWVKPQLTCRVKSQKQSEEGQLQNPEWDRLLGTMDAKAGGS